MNCPRCGGPLFRAGLWCPIDGDHEDMGYRPAVETPRDGWPVDGRPGHPRGVARNQRLFEREMPLPGFEVLEG